MRPLIKSYLAATAVAAGGLIIKAAAPATDTTVAVATAATDAILGVADSLGADAGTPIDVTLLGLAQVRVGANVAMGDPLTADATSRAIKCVGATGVTKMIIGYALAPGAVGDIIPMRVAPGVLQLP